MHTEGKPRIVSVLETVKETPDITTLSIDAEVRGKPGQYLMVWVPGIDEIPMSLSRIGNPAGISVRVVGEATTALANLKKGDRVGIRGPFGNGYTLKGRRPLIIGGGSGLASVAPLLDEMKAKGIEATLLMGARSSNQLLFKERFQRLLGGKVVISTDDGSEGHHGYASEYATSLLKTGEYDYVYTCGPELMMLKVFQAAEAKGIECQMSMERICKCAVGLCGSCVIGPFRVCQDGPIFDSAMLRLVRDEFGKSRMDASGRSVKVSH